MEAVEKDSMSPTNVEELIQINDALPSLLYVASKKTLFPNKMQDRIFNLIDYLINKKWLYPKNLKKVFYRIIDIETDEDRLHKLFLNMESTHKVYFLLSVYGLWTSRQKHRELLEKFVKTGLQDENTYVLGFSLAIAAHIDLEISTIIDQKVLINKLSEDNNKFALIKWLPTIEYLTRPSDERALIKGLIGQNSPSLMKTLLYSNLSRMPNEYVDSVYLTRLLSTWEVLLLPVVCELFAIIVNKDDLFFTLLEYMLKYPSYKKLIISIVSKQVFEIRRDAGYAEIENLRTLYDLIHDGELKRSLLDKLSRIKEFGLPDHSEFAKKHKEIDRYNECFLFKKMDKSLPYDYIELIPESKVTDNMSCNVDTFKDFIEDLSEKEVLPPTEYKYNSSTTEISIQYNIENRFEFIDPTEFFIDDQSIIRACVLASEVYGKACYFRHITGKVPYIDSDNLLVDKTSESLRILSFGRSLSKTNIINNIRVGDSLEDIAIMIGILLEKLLFDTHSEYNVFLKAKHLSGIKALLCLFIERLKSNTPDRRYSYERFAYLVEQMRNFYKSNNAVEVLYMRERLKDHLFRFNSNNVTWKGTCRALDEHINHDLRDICSPELLLRFPFRSYLFFARKGKSKLHIVSKQLLNLALSRKDIPDVDAIEPAYVDLLEFLLLYGVLCIEVLALARSLQDTKRLERLKSSTLQLLSEKVQINAGIYKKEIHTKDIISFFIKRDNSDIDDYTNSSSLQQLAILTLISLNITFGSNDITIHKPENVSSEVFQSLAHLCLYRIPNIELKAENELSEVFSALSNNDDINKVKSIADFREAVNVIADDLQRVRRDIGITRKKGRADGRYFPPTIRCKDSLLRTISVCENELPNCPLTHGYPTRKKRGYPCSWDCKSSKPLNVMIPSESIYLLIDDLTKGKIFGYKLSYLYSGRIMTVWDIVIIVVIVLALGFCLNQTSSNTIKGILLIIFSSLLLTILSKLLIIDLQYWGSGLKNAINYIRNKFR